MNHDQVTVEHLSVRYPTGRGTVTALDEVDFRLEPGVTLGLAGESGSGKTTLVNAISGGLSRRKAQVAGNVHIGSASMLELTSSELRTFRQETLGHIGQDPHAVLDPTIRVGRQLQHALGTSGTGSSVDADYRHHFGRVGLPNPVGVAAHYPHQLSGGMAQRVVIAMALAREPSIIIADEPTASLDSTLRTHILDLITGLAAASGATLVMVSHDLAAIRRYCELTAVMYGGRVVELGETPTVFAAPQHPYTAALLAASPGQEAPGERLTGIPGTQNVRYDAGSKCVFVDRCPYRVEKCAVETPTARAVAGHNVACHRAHELVLTGKATP